MITATWPLFIVSTATVNDLINHDLEWLGYPAGSKKFEMQWRQCRLVIIAILIINDINLGGALSFVSVATWNGVMVSFLVLY